MTKDSGDVFNEIKEILNQNGSMTQPTRDRLIMTAVVAINQKMDNVIDAVNVMTARQDASDDACEKLDDKIKELDRISIVKWVERHPKLTVVIAVMVLMVLSNFELLKIIMTLLGYPNVLP